MGCTQLSWPALKSYLEAWIQREEHIHYNVELIHQPLVMFVPTVNGEAPEIEGSSPLGKGERGQRERDTAMGCTLTTSA